MYGTHSESAHSSDRQCIKLTEKGSEVDRVSSLNLEQVHLTRY